MKWGYVIALLLKFTEFDVAFPTVVLKNTKMLLRSTCHDHTAIQLLVVATKTKRYQTEISACPVMD